MESDSHNRQSTIGNRQSDSNRQSAGNRQSLCWQGWRITVPSRWNPVKLEGNFEAGYVLLADLQRPRLGLRWSSGRRIGKNPDAWAAKVMRDEVGQLAAAEAVDHPMPDGWRLSRLYLEPQPPGRDVWLGFSEVSGRAIEVIHHAHRRDRVLTEVLLPTLADMSDDDPRPWSVLDLNCLIPRDLKLEKPLLFAGDLGLRFAGDRKRRVLVRQIAPASVAIKRMPIERWLKRQQSAESKHYRPGKTQEPVKLTTDDGRELTGLQAELKKRRRFVWKPGLLKRMRTIVVHDELRDRLVIVEGGGENVDLMRIAGSVGGGV